MEFLHVKIVSISMQVRKFLHKYIRHQYMNVWYELRGKNIEVKFIGNFHHILCSKFFFQLIQWICEVFRPNLCTQSTFINFMNDLSLSSIIQSLNPTKISNFKPQVELNSCFRRKTPKNFEVKTFKQPKEFWIYLFLL